MKAELEQKKCSEETNSALATRIGFFLFHSFSLKVQVTVFAR